MKDKKIERNVESVTKEEWDIKKVVPVKVVFLPQTLLGWLPCNYLDRKLVADHLRLVQK